MSDRGTPTGEGDTDDPSKKTARGTGTQESLNNATEGDAEDELKDSGSSYTIPALHQRRRPRQPQGDSANPDDDSNYPFMSEPSVSEDGDVSSGNVIRAPHRASTSEPLHPHSTSSDERRGGVLSPTPLMTQPSPVPNSPGNTSLSSWESPAVNKQRVLLHFGPNERHEGTYVRVRKNSSPGGLVVTNSRGSSVSSLPHPSSGHDSGEGMTMPDRGLSTPKTADASRQSATGISSQHHPSNMDRFLHNLQVEAGGSSDRSEGSIVQRKQATPGDASSGGLRMDRESSVFSSYNSLQSAGASALAAEHLLSPLSSTVIDESIAMTLSDSEHESDKEDDNDDDLRPGQDSGSQMSADDERTNARSPPRARTGRPKQSPGHRRTRSGDAAAASMAVGGNWKGMEQDNIPMPRSAEEDDDDDDEEEDNSDQAVKSRQRKDTGQSTSQGTRDTYPGRAPRPPLAQSRLTRSERTIKDTNAQRPQPRHQQRASYGGSTGNQMGGSGGWPAHQNPYQSWSPSPPSQPLTNSERNYYNSFSSYSNQPSHSGAVQQALNNFRDRYDSDDSEDSDRDGPYEERFQSNREKRAQFDLDTSSDRYDTRIRPKYSESPFANIGKKSSEKVPRRAFLPQTSIVEDDDQKYHYYTCPRCGSRQREFFSVATAPQQLDGPSSYLALYFCIYVVASLFIFGLEEGWKPLDCIYFAVITLTTAGLGDFVPTTDANKIICSIFIYFGVACIGLLLGSYIAGMLDDRASRDRKARQIESCPNCKRIQTIKDAARRHTPRRPSADQLKPPTVSRFMSDRPNDYKAQPAVLDYNYNQGPIYPPGVGNQAINTSQNFELTTPPQTEGKNYDGSSQLNDGPDSSGVPPRAKGPQFYSPTLSASPPDFTLSSPVTRNVWDLEMIHRTSCPCLPFPYTFVVLP